MVLGLKVDPKKLETGLRTISAGIPYALLLRIEAIGFPTFGASTVWGWGIGLSGLAGRGFRSAGFRHQGRLEVLV